MLMSPEGVMGGGIFGIAHYGVGGPAGPRTSCPGGHLVLGQEVRPLNGMSPEYNKDTRVHSIAIYTIAIARKDAGAH